VAFDEITPGQQRLGVGWHSADRQLTGLELVSIR
jgi:hypothetical protein